MVRFESFSTVTLNDLQTAELLTVAQTMAALNKPAKRDYTSVKNYFLDEAPLDAEDEYYIYRKEDIITLKPGRENAWLDGVIERILQKLNCPPVRVRHNTHHHGAVPRQAIC
jgi:hypothetical protein